MKKYLGLTCLLCVIGFTQPGHGQSDPLQKAANEIHESTKKQISLRAEERTRWEQQEGVKFGKSVNQQDMLSRLRIGMTYTPAPWFTVSAMGQDARAPFYGKLAPSSVRETIDLQESWLALSSKRTGANFSMGRRMLDYGETRVIGTPQWSNTSRTYDFGRMQYISKKMTLEGLLVSPVIILPDAFNKPELGNRIWGTYDIFPKVWHGVSIDAYALRHSQNKIGGWTGTGTLGTNTYGARLYGPLPAHFAYSLESMGQNGHQGALGQRSYAWFAGISRPVAVPKMPVNLSFEYKGASGSRLGSSHNSTYDQLAPANHDKFGHLDLFGWRNLKTIKTLDTVKLTKAATFNFMYTNEYLYSASDALYASNGSQLFISKKGTAGTHVGQEVDGFMTYAVKGHTFYAGVGHFFKGDFIQHTTPGINPRYFYIGQQYVIK